MNARAGSGWQTVLADLSLILFMVSAAAVREVDAGGSAISGSEPVAQWRADPEALSLADWLAAQSDDSRQRLTILAPVAAADEALALARGSTRPARIVLDPAVTGPPLALLSYDLSPDEESR